MPSLRQQNPRLYDRVYDSLRRGNSGAETSRKYRNQFGVSDYQVQKIRRHLLQTSDKIRQSRAGQFSRRSQRSYRTYRRRVEPFEEPRRVRRYPVIESQTYQTAPYQVVADVQIYCDSEEMDNPFGSGQTTRISFNLVFLPSDRAIEQNIDAIVEQAISTARGNPTEGYSIIGCDGEITWDIVNVRIYSRGTQAA